MFTSLDLESALAELGRFLDQGPLTRTIADLEFALEGRRGAGIAQLLRDAGATAELLQAARFVRGHVGRINDVVHATAITVALQHLLGPDEVLKRPSLAAGNDPTRPFDVETDRRVMEFKLADWGPGGNATRKRQLFKDLVYLAADSSGRVAELYVLGSAPGRFLTCTKAKAGWALDRTPAARDLFQLRFGSLDRGIGEFVRAEGARVAVIDLQECLPEIFALP